MESSDSVVAVSLCPRSCSAPNQSQLWRRNIITVYNSRHNEPDPEMAAISGQPFYSPINPVPDQQLLAAGVCVTTAANEYLDQSAADESIQKELGKKAPAAS